MKFYALYTTIFILRLLTTSRRIHCIIVSRVFFVFLLVTSSRHISFTGNTPSQPIRSEDFKYASYEI